MIRLIEGARPTHFSAEIEAMFRNRAEVFFDRLNWDVAVENGYERDAFDEEYPLYLISLDPVRVNIADRCGCCRPSGQTC